MIVFCLFLANLQFLNIRWYVNRECQTHFQNRLVHLHGHPIWLTRKSCSGQKFFHNHNNRSIIKCNGPKFSNPAFVVGGQVANGAEKFYCRLVPLNIRDPAGSLTSPGCQTSGDDDVDGTATVTGAHKGSKNPGKTPITATKPMALAVNSLQKKKSNTNHKKLNQQKSQEGRPSFGNLKP